jgi:hypothetical protein
MSATFEEALALVLQLDLQERLSLMAELESSLTQVQARQSGHWGQTVLRVLDELGPIDLIHPEIEDPVAWVKQIRQEQSEKRLGSWDTES